MYEMEPRRARMMKAGNARLRQAAAADTLGFGRRCSRRHSLAVPNFSPPPPPPPHRRRSNNHAEMSLVFAASRAALPRLLRSQGTAVAHTRASLSVSCAASRAARANATRAAVTRAASTTSASGDNIDVSPYHVDIPDVSITQYVVDVSDAARRPHVCGVDVARLRCAAFRLSPPCDAL